MSAKKFIIRIDPSDLVPKSSAKLYYYGAFWVAVIQAGVIAGMWKYIPKVVPLFFTEPWGEARLAPKMFLILLPMLTLAAIVTNLIVGRRAREESPLLSYALAVASLLVAVMFAISLWGILQSLL
jgi:O-antigen/teichoic acid export membrane protein